jgi:hypothetical protein
VSSLINFLLLAKYRQQTTSIPDRMEMDKNLLNSGFVWPVEPSAIFREMELDAL